MADKQVLIEEGSANTITTTAGSTAVGQVKIQFDEATPMATVVALVEKGRGAIVEYYTKR